MLSADTDVPRAFYFMSVAEGMGSFLTLFWRTAPVSSHPRTFKARSSLVVVNRLSIVRYKQSGFLGCRTLHLTIMLASNSETRSIKLFYSVGSNVKQRALTSHSVQFTMYLAQLTQVTISVRMAGTAHSFQSSYICNTFVLALLYSMPLCSFFTTCDIWNQF